MLGHIYNRYPLWLTFSGSNSRAFLSPLYHLQYILVTIAALSTSTIEMACQRWSGVCRNCRSDTGGRCGRTLRRYALARPQGLYVSYRELGYGSKRMHLPSIGDAATAETEHHVLYLHAPRDACLNLQGSEESYEIL